MKKLSLSDISAGIDDDMESYALVKEEETDYEADRLALENHQLRLRNKNLEQDIALRKKWSVVAFLFTAFIILCVFIVVCVDALFSGFDVPESVLIALITGVAVESIGITAIVTRYLFPSK